MIQGKRRIGEILLEEGILNEEQLERALQFHSERGIRLGEALVALGFASEVQVTKALARQYGLPFVDLEKGAISKRILSSIPGKMAEEHKIIPVKVTGDFTVVAVQDPQDIFHLDNLAFFLNTPVKGALASPQAFRTAFRRYYGVDLSEENEKKTVAAVDPKFAAAVEEEEDDAPIIRLVTKTIEEAVENRASDIHFEPFENRVRIRYRIDGILQEAATHPKHLQASLLSRVKILSNMDIAEKRKPQDGRINLKVRGKMIDIRVSALPGNHGESLVLRLLDKEKGLVSMEELGFHSSDYNRFKRIIKRPNGIFLVTGPTGSGKTTTLYAALKHLNQPDVKIITAENPIEYHISGINQCEVRHNIGLDFSRILRSMLRQAPNIILVGEIRDLETANIAIQAALTGHLVFSTLHTNDATSALTRLIDLGVKPFLVASAVQAVMAQRLIRVLCSHCKEPYEPEESDWKALGIAQKELKGKTVFKAVGCERCQGSGFFGRIGIFELMEMDSKLRDMTYHVVSTGKLREQARISGNMVTLKEDGIRKVLNGITSFSEVFRVTAAEEV